MVYILTLLFIAPFVSRRESRWFTVAYAFILLAAKEIRIYLEYVGAEFFLFTSYVQIFCMFCSIFLLDKHERVFAGLVFFAFSVYNVCIAIWLGYIPLEFYTFISITVTYIQIFIVTFKEKGFLKNVSMVGVVWATSTLASRFI